MTTPAYPLEQILDVKKKRVEEAERTAKEKKQALELEQKKLQELEEVRDKALNHYQDKLTQLRQALDEISYSNRIQQMKEYLKLAKEALEKERVKVSEQKKKVDAAQLNYDAALKILREKEQEVDKLNTHKSEWTKEELRELMRKEELAMDEIGSVIYINRQRQKTQKSE